MTATVAMRRRAAQELQRRYGSDPVRFAEEVLGMRVWDGQAAILRAPLEHGRTAVRSGHKTGKSTACAMLTVWWALFRPQSTVLMTSATYRQVEKILWKELRGMVQRVQARGMVLGGELRKRPETGWVLDHGSEVFGMTADNAESIAGFSGANLLLIVDEASGIDERLFEALEGNRAGGARMLLTGNPTQPSGTFFDAFNEAREFWHQIHLSSADTPNAQHPDRPELHIPGLATAEWVAERRREWAGTPMWDVRVEGNFPRESSDAVVALADVEAATRRWEDDGAGFARDPASLHLGVDVASFGDDESVIQPVRGRYAARCRVFASIMGTDLAREIVRAARELRRDQSEHVTVVIDEGGVGVGTVDALVTMKREAERALDWIRVSGVHFGSAADNPDEHADLRTQLWFGAAAWLRDEAVLDADKGLERELVATRYRLDPRGRLRIEAKADTRKRLGRSPDRADALCLACYRGQRFQAEAVRGVADHLPRSESARLGRFF